MPSLSALFNYFFETKASMKTNIVTLLVVLVGIASSIFWIEAEKEIEILCGMIQPGQSIEKVNGLLETGEHLEYKLEGRKLRFHSIKNLYSISCSVDLQNTTEVATVRFSERIDLKILTILIGSICTFLLMIFQIALASGRPLGEYAWGGFNKELPDSLRKASAVSAIILLIGILSLLSLNYISFIPEGLSGYIVAGFALMFMFSILGNLASISKKEKMVMIPASVVLFLCYFTAAYSSF